MAFDQVAQDVVDTLANVYGTPEECGKVTVIGHSYGGKVAMRMAHDHPEWVERLVIVDIAPVIYDRGIGHVDLLDTMLRVNFEGCKTVSDVCQELARLGVEGDMQINFIGTNVRFDKDNTGRRRPIGWLPNVQEFLRTYDDVRGMPGVLPKTLANVPMLFIRGANSSFLTAEHESLVSDYFPQAQIVPVEGAGHWVHAQKPDVVRKLIGEFCMEK